MRRRVIVEKAIATTAEVEIFKVEKEPNRVQKSINKLIIVIYFIFFVAGPWSVSSSSKGRTRKI